MFQSIASTGQIHRGSRAEFQFAALLAAVALLVFGAACKSDSEAQRVRPRQLRDVPAQRLAFTFAADVEAPANLLTEEAKPIQAIQQDFDVRRKDEALVLHRTVASPDGQRALALYSEEDESSATFHIAIAWAAGLRGPLDEAILMFFAGCGLSRLARYNITAVELAGTADKVPYFEGTPITFSVIPLGILLAAHAHGPLGVLDVFGLALHPLALVFVVSGSLMISKTIRIPKP